MKIQNKKGFTLIELLVVITIIGILATGAVATYTSQIQKARDTNRVNSMKAMQTAVEQVYGDKAEYPTKVDTGSVASYMPQIPKDLKDGQAASSNSTTTTTTKLGYYYASGPDSNTVTQQRYEISIGFESNGNVTSKADNTKDNGGDNGTTESTCSAGSTDESNARLEVGIPGSTGKLDLESCSGGVVSNVN